MSLFTRQTKSRFHGSAYAAFLALLGGILALESCAKKPSNDSRETPRDPQLILAKIGDENLTQGEFTAFLQERFPAAPTPAPRNHAVLSELLDEAIHERLLLQAARKNGIQPSEGEVREWLANTALTQGPSAAPAPRSETPARLEQARAILTLNQYLQRLSASQPSLPSGAEKDYYQARPEMFQEPEQYHVLEIRVKDEPLAKELERRLARRRESFESLARKYSRNPAASAGGDLGWFARGQLPEPFEKVVWALKPKEHSSIVQTDYGFHLFKLKEIRKSRLVPFEKARPEIQKILMGELKKKMIAQEVERLRNATPIKIELAHLGFNYLEKR